MRYFIVLTIVALASTAAYCEEPAQPNFLESPEHYSELHWITNASGDKFWVANQLLIGNRTGGTVEFWVSIIGPNFHQCGVAGLAQKLSAAQYKYEEGKCRLLFKFDKQRAMIHDVNGYCQQESCGARASLEGATFVRVPK